MANLAKDIFEFIWIPKFQNYMNREIVFCEINFTTKPKDYFFSVEI